MTIQSDSCGRINTSGLSLPSEPWILIRWKHASIHSSTSPCASSCVRKRLEHQFPLGNAGTHFSD